MRASPHILEETSEPAKRDVQWLACEIRRLRREMDEVVQHHMPERRIEVQIDRNVMVMEGPEERHILRGASRETGAVGEHYLQGRLVFGRRRVVHARPMGCNRWIGEHHQREHSSQDECCSDHDGESNMQDLEHGELMEFGMDIDCRRCVRDESLPTKDGANSGKEDLFCAVVHARLRSEGVAARSSRGAPRPRFGMIVSGCCSLKFKRGGGSDDDAMGDRHSRDDWRGMEYGAYYAGGVCGVRVLGARATRSVANELGL